jgi:hypothetical protein
LILRDIVDNMSRYGIDRHLFTEMFDVNDNCACLGTNRSDYSVSLCDEPVDPQFCRFVSLTYRETELNGITYVGVLPAEAAV